MTPRQIALVQDSFAGVLPVTDAAAASFYQRLFELAPATRSLFRTDMTEQGRKLFLTLATVVDALDRPEEIAPVARELAIRHRSYGVLPEHYAPVGAALLDTLRSAPGPAFDAETEAAWRTAYGFLADTMLAAVAEQP